MKQSRTAQPETASTRADFVGGRSCGECLLLAAVPEGSPARDVLIRAVSGLAGGRGGVCTLLIAGVLALSEKFPPAEAGPVPSNDLFDTYVPQGWPGSGSVRPSPQVGAFVARFEKRAAKFGDLRCRSIADTDWPLVLEGARKTFPLEQCVELADGAAGDLAELYGAA